MATGPLILTPRLDPKPWGGRRLAEFGFDLPPDELVGEAVITAPEAIIGNGPHAGRTLGQIVHDDPAAALGERGLAATGNRPLFPLLVKLIDANEDLSIQVHPTDEDARAEHSLGKTEAWHVLDAAPGGALYLGLRPDASMDELEEFARAGKRTGGLLRRLEAKPHATVLIPAGTIHALGAGVLVYEIQQPSAITYRLDDWGRVDAAGKSRNLHIDQSVRVANADYRPEFIAPVELHRASGRAQLLTACRYFALERIALAAGESLTLPTNGSAQVFTCLQGGLTLSADGMEATMAAGQTAALLAASLSAMIQATSPMVTLRAWVPDLAAEIVQPARASGAGDDAIGHLGGPLADVRVALR
ncbi:MAG: type I phosphomannose isomerase catalytic subunit [Thermomicrobiales bacterium]